MATVPRSLSYVRNKYVGIVELGEDHFQASTLTEDTLFAGEVTMIVRFPELEITSIKGQIKRSLNKECQQAIPILQKAVGLRIEPGITNKVDGLIGTGDGCTNMANLILETCHSVVTGVRRRMGEHARSRGLGRAESQRLMLQRFPSLAHQCITWSTADVQHEIVQDEAAVLPVYRPGLNSEVKMLTHSLLKFVGVGRLDKDTFWVCSNMQTPAHDYTVEIQVKLPQFELISVEGQMRRSPGEVCQQAIPKLQNAVGVRIERGLTAVIDEKVGRPGCPRMANLLLEGCHAVLQGTAIALLEDCRAEGRVPSGDEFKKRWLESVPIMRNSCLAYRDLSSPSPRVRS